MMRILVTGGAEFIGSHLAEHWLRRGHRIGIINNLDSFYDPRARRANLFRGRHPVIRQMVSEPEASLIPAGVGSE